MTLITVPCDVCGSTNFKLVYSGTVAAADSNVAAYYSSSRSRAGHLPIVRCVNCGLVMTNPRDDDATLAQVYAGLQDVVYDVEDENRRYTAQRFLALVQEFRPPPARLLDVGCATGLFIREAHQAGYQVTGLEASEWAVARARERCGRAATIVSGFLEKTDLPPQSFDVITAWDVLEHVSRPTEIAQRLRGWLADDGWLFLNVPDIESRIARLMGKRWVLLLREHLWYYSPATMSALLGRTGFEPIRFRSHMVQFSAANVLGRAAQYPAVVGRLSARLASSNWLERITLRFPMGEMNVVARKRFPLNGGR